MPKACGDDSLAFASTISPRRLAGSAQRATIASIRCVTSLRCFDCQPIREGRTSTASPAVFRGPFIGTGQGRLPWKSASIGATTYSHRADKRRRRGQNQDGRRRYAGLTIQQGGNAAPFCTLMTGTGKKQAFACGIRSGCYHHKFTAPPDVSIGRKSAAT